MELTVNGVRSRFDMEGEGETVVLLHGWAGRADSMRPLYNALKGSRRVLSVDFPGFGLSAEPPCPWSVTEYAQWLGALLDALGIGACSLVGHSFGGRVALVFAAGEGERVKRMVLTGVPGLKGKRTLKARMRGMIYKCLKTLAGLLPRGGRMRERLALAFGSEDYRACAPSFRPTFVRVVNQDLTPYLKDITASTLLVWGENDTAAPLWMARKMESDIRDAGLVVYNGMGHFAYLENIGPFTAAVTYFLKPEGAGH